MGEGGGPCCGALRGSDVASDLCPAPLRQPRLQQFQPSRDPGQQVVEVVRQAPGQLAHSLHLLALPQLLLKPLAVGDVPPDGKEYVLLRRRRPIETAIGAVLGPQAHVEVTNRLAFDQGRERRLHRRLVLRMA